jgi:hypothetical protein
MTGPEPRTRRCEGCGYKFVVDSDDQVYCSGICAGTPSAYSLLRVLPPDEENVIPGAGSSVADGTVPIRIDFRDAAGVRWRAASRGELTEVTER